VTFDLISAAHNTPFSYDTFHILSNA